MSKFESFINGVPDEFEAFITAMATEYNKHRLNQGDSWKDANIYWLYHLFNDSLKNKNDLFENPSHFIDIANYCWFLWYRLKDDEHYQNKMKS